ncbi:hypothetical protein AVEN_143631-1 [Araneus ventricosus]|uniref:Uncharacterized protein n=1 Tax=Araneus ventricosus TaxID=182803 RepID=A0A4Y2ANE8_ARAVE|nr:hypothetical protein AVEN_143631-1 [Araneus ventricosus]
MRYQSVKFGPKHILKVVEITSQTRWHLPDDIKRIIDPVIERKAFFCHPKEMLLTMIVDTQIAILVCNKVAAILLCKSASLTRKECKLEPSYCK